jgi:serine/threonine-protein kinase
MGAGTEQARELIDFTRLLGGSPPDEEASDKTVARPGQTLEAGEVRCHRDCGRSLATAVDADGRWRELNGHALYVCEECAAKMTCGELPCPAIGNYTLLRELGRGGMMEVYLGRHRQTGRMAAVRRLLPDLALPEKANRRFLREMTVMGRIAHRHLVRYYEHGEHERLYFVACEYLPGGDLQQAVTRPMDQANHPLAPDTAVRLICQGLEGLAHLHAAGIVHRDVKPANLLLSGRLDDPATIARLGDCGLAKSYLAAGGSNITKTGQISGPLMFMAPEQITNYKYVRPAADVYAMGATLYYLLTGDFTLGVPGLSKSRQAVVAEGRGAATVIEHILDTPPTPILERALDLPEKLAAVVDMAVRKDANERFGSAEELRAALIDAMPPE